MGWKKKCPSCARKIEKKFNFCPYCGCSFKKFQEQENFGMLGRDDMLDRLPEMAPNIGFPGLDKMMNSLVKQLEKQMTEMSKSGENTPIPKGFKIQISTGRPKINQAQIPQTPEKTLKLQEIKPEEQKRRKSLPIKEPESTIRRLSDKLLYEISVPGVKSKKDIVMQKLENSIEIKAYSKDHCYFKTIPLRVEIIGIYLKNEKLFLELKG